MAIKDCGGCLFHGKLEMPEPANERSSLIKPWTFREGRSLGNLYGVLLRTTNKINK